MTLQHEDHAPECEIRLGRYCSCGTDELWENSLDRLRETATQKRCPLDGAALRLQEQEHQVTCPNGHQIPVSDEE